MRGQFDALGEITLAQRMRQQDPGYGTLLAINEVQDVGEHLLRA
ncbi:hypothetical protein [Pseudomonas sp. AP19]|nr:hypothetical protein [Pseudomonas sp. AP19]